MTNYIDEAAEEYVKDYGYTEDDYKRERIIAEEHFKAGAKWMAGLFETIDGEITTTSDNGWEIIRIPKKLYPLGTEVTVQIRKK